MTEDAQPYSPDIDDLAIACDYLINCLGTGEAKLIGVMLKPESFDDLYAILSAKLEKCLWPDPLNAADQISINGVTFHRGDSTP